MRVARLLPLLGLIVLSPASLAQDAPETTLPDSMLIESTVPEQLIGMVGDWRLEQEDQSLPPCIVNFTEDQVPGGWAVTVPEPCPAPYPAAASLAIWSVDEADGAVVILDASGAQVLRLVEGEDGLFHTMEGVVPAFYLVLPWDEDGTGGEVGEEIKG
jgi:hypothetical protein